METFVCDRPLGKSLDHRQILPIGPRPRLPLSAPQRDSGRACERDYETEALHRCEVGKLCLEVGRYREALEQFEQALTLHPHDVESWCSRADALACLGRYEDALESLEQTQELAGMADVRLWVQKAVLLILLNRPAAALNCCNQALWRSPNHTQAWLFRGVALHRLGQFRAATRSYERVAHPALPFSIDSLRRLCRDVSPSPQAS